MASLQGDMGFVTQGDLNLKVDGVGDWTLPAFSSLPCVHSAPGQQGRSIVVGENLSTLLVSPPEIVRIDNEFYLASDKLVTKITDLTFPQRITAADGSVFVATSPENVVALSVIPRTPRQTEPAVVITSAPFIFDPLSLDIGNGSLNMSIVSGSEGTTFGNSYVSDLLDQSSTNGSEVQLLQTSTDTPNPTPAQGMLFALVLFSYNLYSFNNVQLLMNI
jgi:hypothetical protein